MTRCVSFSSKRGQSILGGSEVSLHRSGLSLGLIELAAEYAKFGLAWESEFRQAGPRGGADA